MLFDDCSILFTGLVLICCCLVIERQILNMFNRDMHIITTRFAGAIRPTSHPTILCRLIHTRHRRHPYGRRIPVSKHLNVYHAIISNYHQEIVLSLLPQKRIRLSSESPEFVRNL